MKTYTKVSRKTVEEDRVAICPNFGCEFMTRVKPIKLRFFGFGKYPKCKKHHIPLVYVDERIIDFVNAALACLFDKAGLPPRELLERVKSKFPDEVTSFVEGWVYCITVGRGAPIVSRYMDTISNAYLKQLTKKQIKAIKKGYNSKSNLVNKAIKDGMDEICIQYTRILKHLRVHSEILSEPENLKPLSKSLRNYLEEWQKNMLTHNAIVNSPENKHVMALEEIKYNYDQILNAGTCRCLVGLNPESKDIKKAKISAFDRFFAYHEFFKEDLTSKFTKSAVINLLKMNKCYQKGVDEKSENSEALNINEEFRESFNNELKRKIENSMEQRDGQPREIKKIDIIALEHYKEFIENQFLNAKNLIFISKGFLDNLVKQIKSLQGDLPDNRIAEILYGTSNGSEALAFATLKSKKYKRPNSLIDENILDNWLFNLKQEFPSNYAVFFDLIHDYKLLCAEKCVFGLVEKWNSYCSKVCILGLNMEMGLFDYLESVLTGTLIENLSFELSCGCSNHEKFSVSYKHLYRAVCPLCSRIKKSHSYQDFVREAELRNARFKLTETEFMTRINQELKKPRSKQQKVSEILFPFICNQHGEFNISMERIKDYKNWCAECYYTSTRLTGEQIIARGEKYNLNLETPLSYIEKLNQPSRETLLWSCKYHPSFRFKSQPDEFSLDLKSCDICSGGKITNERIMRYLFSRLFHKNFGEKPTPLYKILPRDKVVNLLPSDYKTLRSYNHMHFDAFAYINIKIGEKTYTLSVASEYWDREHSSLEEYVNRFRHRTPRNGSFANDYQHLKSSDRFKQNLKNRGFIDIYIVVNHTIRRDNYLEFIISEFEQQIRNLFKVNNYRLRNISHCNWRDLKQIDKLRQTFGDVLRFI
jgi:hypothetical protein